MGSFKKPKLIHIIDERDSLEPPETRPRNLTFLCFFLDNLNLFTKETRFSVP